MSLYQEIFTLLKSIEYNRKEDTLLDAHQITNLKAQFDLLISRVSEDQGDEIQELIKEREHARDIIENSNILVFEWTLSPEIPTIYVSNNIKQFGYTPADFYTGDLKDYWDFVYEPDRAIAKKNVYTARSLPIEEFRHSYRIITRDKQIRWIEERIIFNRDQNGIVQNEKGILLDITEIKDLEIRLKHSKERYEKLFENAAALIFTVDSKGNVSAANRKFLVTFDMRRGDLKRLKFLSLLTEAYQLQFSKIDIIKFVESYRSRPFDIEMINSKGAVYIFSASASVLESSDGALEIEFIAFDVTEKKRVEEEIAYLSYHDKLTDCFNRAYFDEELDRVDSLQVFPYSIIVGDMNGLKEVNDLLGHRAGDQLLVRMAEIIKQSCRETDIVARFGGDEFAILCPNTNEEGARSIIQRIRQTSSKEKNYVIKPSIALGASTKHDIFTSAEDLFKQADHQMYKNKLSLTHSRRNSLIGSLHHTLEGHTHESKVHIQKIQNCSKALGELLHLHTIEFEELNLAAMLHDIGKIFVPDDLLIKKDSLTDKEREILHSHSEMGYQILHASNITSSISEHVLHHHEQWDGNGYPKGLKGESIPLVARIISISDSFVSMMEDRNYRPSKSFEVSIQEIKSSSGVKFDPKLVSLIVENEMLFKGLLVSAIDEGMDIDESIMA